MKNYEIYPIYVGDIENSDKSNFGYRLDPGVKISAPFLCFLIKGNEQLILVDTGPCEEEWALKYHYKIRKTKEMTIEKGLEKLGVLLEDIKIVVFTHLHWDHVYNHELFKNAKFYVQKKEVDFALNPLPTQYISYESFYIGMTPPFVSAMPKFELINGDFNLMEGIDLVTLPGHTPGSQGVLVNTKKGKYLIAGDAVQIYECLEKNVYGHGRACGILVDLFSYYDTLNKIDRIADFVIPSHDWKVLDHEVYPVKD